LTDPRHIELWESGEGIPLSFSRRLPNNIPAKCRLPSWLGKVLMTEFTEK